MTLITDAARGLGGDSLEVRKMPRDWPQRIDHGTVLANFKVPAWKQKPKESWRARRPGNDPEHLANIRLLQCSLCGERGRFVQAHHLRSAGAAKERGVGMKSSDKHAVPLCVFHHSEIHNFGSRREIAYFEQYGIDCHALAQGLWNRRSDPSGMARVLLSHQLAAIAQKGRRHVR